MFAHPSQMPFNTGRLPNRCVTGITTLEPFNCISGQRLANEIFSFSFPAFYFNNQLFWDCTALSSLVPLSRLLYAKAHTAGCAFFWILANGYGESRGGFYHVLKQVKSLLAMLCSMGEVARHYKVISSVEFG